MKTKRTSTAVQRWGKCALTLLLACALLAGLAITASARGTDWQGEVVDPAIPKPTVTIQGNLVVDKPGGKPTGFYELALCVRSGRTIYGPDPAAGYAVGTEKELTEAEYAQVLSDIEKNLVPMGITQDSYTLTYYPFRTATAAVNVNTDVLTAVNWAIQNVTYQSYDPATGYAKDAADPGAYPRGIDTDVAVQGYDALGLTTAEAFPDITTPDLLVQPSVAIDVEGDSRMFAATGQVDYYDATANAALLTLSASAPSNKSIILTEDTPLVVARFSYDLKRFSETKVNTTDWTTDVQNSATGSMNGEGLWLGWDKSDIAPGNSIGMQLKTPLTWLGESVDNSTATPAGYARDFAVMDKMIARTRMNQSVWVHMETNSEDLTQRDTYFYYYLGAEEDQRTAGQTKRVNTASGIQEIKNIDVPVTEGATVLTQGNDLNTATAPDTPADYTYFKNLLRLKDQTLVVKLVNDVTFKKPAGVGGNIIEFYDWDDTYLGSLIVGDGDVRETVNEYVEKNMVHPDLRAGDILANKLGGNLPDFTQPITPGSDAEEYANILNSLDREYTYRGKYSSKVDGTGVVRDEAGEVATDPNSVPGKEYKLTNKIDYAFYRHLNAVTTVEYQDAGGNTVSERYITTQPLTSNADAAQYPWAYGWAIVEDNSVRNQNSWQARRDGAKTVETWTTFGVGELEDADPAYDTAANPGVQAVPTALPAGTTPVPGSTLGGGTGIETSWPDFVDTATVTAPTDYAYKLDAEDSNDYLRFADFSDMKAQFSKTNQNVLVVKAVYEPGPELLEGYSYRMIQAPYYNKLNSYAASAGGAYSVEITLERTSEEHPDGFVRGVNRVRLPSIRQDTTIDQKWIQDVDRGVNNDLSNPSITTAKNLTETTFTKVDIDNGEELVFTLSLSARQNKVDYFTMETYGMNFVSGGQRSASNFDRMSIEHAIDNYNYLTNTTDDAANDAYFDQQGFYYQAARYEVRDGTHGFVLYGTLNYLMEQATLVNHGVISNSAFNVSASNAAFTDINLRVMSGGTAVLPTTPAQQTTIRNALKDAAAWCESNKSPDTWNYERDCAELSYHQLQHYLLGTQYASRAAADADTLDWCHLHKDCFKDSEAAEAPKTWDEVLAAAAETDKDKRDAISLLSGSFDGNIESITGLRASINGDAFGSGKSFQDKIVKAVSDLNTAGRALSWANIQYAILYNSAPPSDAAGQNAALAAYWWYGGAQTRPAGATNLEELMDAAKDYRGVELKDGTTVGGWRFKLDGVDNAYLNMYDGSGTVGADWVALTENLVHHVTEQPDGDQVTTSFYEEQTDYTLFEPTLLDALKLAADAGADPTDTVNFWPRLQYVLIHSATTWPTAIPGDGSAEGTEMEGYWWRNDGKFMIVKDPATMFNVARILADPNPPADAAAQKRRDAAQAAWDKFKADKFATSAFGIFSNLRTTFDASGLPADDFTAFKAQVIAFVGSGLIPDTDPTTNPDLWDQFQYYLVHNGTYDVTDMRTERNAGYYWWKDGGTAGSPVSIVALRNLATAGFASKINGNTSAWDNLTQKWIDDNNFRFPDVASDTDGDTFYLDADLETDAAANDKRYGKHTEMPQLSPAALQAAVEALVQDRYDRQVAADPTGHYHTAPTLTWLDIQHYIVTDAATPGTALDGDVDWAGTLDGTADFADQAAVQSRYWWHSGGINPKKETKTAVESMLEELDAIGADALKALTAAQAVAQVSPKLTNAEVAFRVAATSAAVAGPNAKTAATRLANLMTNVDNAGGDFTKLTWYQVQYALMPATAAGGNGGNGAYQADPAVARAWYINNLTPTAGGANTAGKFKTDWRPAWLKTKEGGDAYKATLSGDWGVAEPMPMPERSADGVVTAPNGAQSASHTEVLADGTIQTVTVTRLPDGTVETTTMLVTPDGQVTTSKVTIPAPTPTPTPDENVGTAVPNGPTTAPTPTPTPDENAGADVPAGPQDPVVPPTVAPTPAPEPEEPTIPVEPEPSPEPVEPSPEPTPEPTDPEADYDEREETPEGEDARAATVGTVVSTGNLGEILQARVKEMLDESQASEREAVTDVEPDQPLAGLGLFLMGVGVGAIAWGGTAPVGLQVVGLPEEKERKRKKKQEQQDEWDKKPRWIRAKKAQIVLGLATGCIAVWTWMAQNWPSIEPLLARLAQHLGG